VQDCEPAYSNMRLEVFSRRVANAASARSRVTPQLTTQQSDAGGVPLGPSRCARACVHTPGRHRAGRRGARRGRDRAVFAPVFAPCPCCRRSLRLVSSRVPPVGVRGERLSHAEEQRAKILTRLCPWQAAVPLTATLFLIVYDDLSTLLDAPAPPASMSMGHASQQARRTQPQEYGRCLQRQDEQGRGRGMEREPIPPLVGGDIRLWALQVSMLQRFQHRSCRAHESPGGQGAPLQDRLAAKPAAADGGHVRGVANIDRPSVRNRGAPLSGAARVAVDRRSALHGAGEVGADTWTLQRRKGGMRDEGRERREGE